MTSCSWFLCSQLYFYVMQSIFYPEERIEIRYDVKGCLAGRYQQVSESGRQRTSQSSQVNKSKTPNRLFCSRGRRTARSSPFSRTRTLSTTTRSSTSVRHVSGHVVSITSGAAPQQRLDSDDEVREATQLRNFGRNPYHVGLRLFREFDFAISDFGDCRIAERLVSGPARD